jgi:hypothetical protein
VVLLCAVAMGLISLVARQPFSSITFVLVGGWVLAYSALLLTNWQGTRDHVLDEQDYWMQRMSGWRRTSRRDRTRLIFVGSTLGVPMGTLGIAQGLIGLVSFVLAWAR